MTTQVQAGGMVNTTLMGGGVLLVVGLGLALVNLMSGGHASFNSGSDSVTWGLPVVNYVFFALASTGLTMVASVAMTFGNKAFYPIAKRCVFLSLVTIAAGFASLALELGHPFRMLFAVPLNFQVNSPLNWMGVFYALFMVLGLLKFMKLHSGDWDSDASKKIGLGALITECLAGGMLGMAFGAMAMRPMWFGTMVPLYFLLTAACTGGAFALLMTYLAYGNEAAMPEKVRSLVQGPLPSALAAVLGFTILVMGYQTVIGLWSNADGMQVWDYTVGKAWFWIEAIALIAAFYLLVSRSSLMVAAVLIIVGLFINRYEFIIGGQLMPLFKGSWVPGLINYTPSMTEWMLTVMAFGIVLAGWAFGEKSLNLAAAPKE
jgi:Ni/Fe-hydrogenase subunit HybB-like protein